MTIMPHDMQGAAPDLTGLHYISFMQRLHGALRPKTYFEIGTLNGSTLALAQCASLAVDPQFAFLDIATVAQVMAKPRLLLFQTTSDDFFALHDPVALLGGRIDLAFLDGMHRCEFLLRDFINTERHCKRNSVVALHDCVPVEEGMAGRTPGSAPPLLPHRAGWWTGDVWRTALLLKRFRPDLAITVLDAQPTGLVLVTNLDPASVTLADGYDAFVRTMLGWFLADIGIAGLMAELGIEPTADYAADEQISGRFWL